MFLLFHSCTRPSNLWLLNPSLLLQEVARKYSDNTKKPLLDPKMSVQYGSVQQQGTVHVTQVYCSMQISMNMCLAVDRQYQDCWICLDKGDVTDLFTPCKCAEVHRQCLKKWMAEVHECLHV